MELQPSSEPQKAKPEGPNGGSGSQIPQPDSQTCAQQPVSSEGNGTVAGGGGGGGKDEKTSKTIVSRFGQEGLRLAGRKVEVFYYKRGCYMIRQSNRAEVSGSLSKKLDGHKQTQSYTEKKQP